MGMKDLLYLASRPPNTVEVNGANFLLKALAPCGLDSDLGTSSPFLRGYCGAIGSALRGGCCFLMTYITCFIRQVTFVRVYAQHLTPLVGLQLDTLTSISSMYIPSSKCLNSSCASCCRNCSQMKEVVMSARKTLGYAMSRGPT